MEVYNKTYREDGLEVIKKFKPGDIVPECDVYAYCQRVHRGGKSEDFVDGDLGERIENNEQYHFIEAKLSVVKKLFDHHEFDVDEDFVKKLSKDKKEKLPPIILDMDNGSIIDGTHKLQAAILRKEKTIDILLGGSLENIEDFKRLNNKEL